MKRKSALLKFVFYLSFCLFFVVSFAECPEPLHKYVIENDMDFRSAGALRNPEVYHYPGFEIHDSIISNQAHRRFKAPAARPINCTPAGEENDEKRMPSDLKDKINKTAKGDNWKEIQAASLRQLLQSKSGHKSSGYSNINGIWQERGPSNIPGRITDVDIDYLNKNIYALSDYGMVFKSSDLKGSNWRCLNDQYSSGLGTQATIKVLPGTPTRVVINGYIVATNDWGVCYTDDDGATWRQSAGINTYDITGIKRTMYQGDTAYLFMQEYNGHGPTDYYTVYKSTDRGGSFKMLYRSAIASGDGGRLGRSDIWVSNDHTNPDFYLFLEDSLFSVNKNTGVRQFKSRISGQNFEYGLLTGLSKNGVTVLKAYEFKEGVGRFYSWSSNAPLWQYKGQLTESWLAPLFGQNSFSCSQISSDTLYFGSILTSRSLDGGTTWTTIDMNPTNEYALYHGDVPKTFNILNPDGKEETYMGTDGGLYKLDPAADHFNSLSVPGLNCTQIYKMVTRLSDPGKMFVGTQDNGYITTLLGTQQTGIVDFNYVWGGDVTNMATGDNGETIWVWWWGEGCNYVTNPDENSVSSTWGPRLQNGSIPYWEAPIWVPAQHPDICYTAGALNSGSGSHLIRVKAIPEKDGIGYQFPFNFKSACGGRINTIATSPLDEKYMYVATDNGYLFSSKDGGTSWNSKFISSSFWPRVIYPSRINLGELWIGGSGYSNSPVYHSTDHGLTVEPYKTGMPPILVEAITANTDESVLFAATGIAPFAYLKSDNTWIDISDKKAPLVHYNDVDFIPSLNTARFATFARGIWDFHMTNPSGTVPDEAGQLIEVNPNPAHDIVILKCGPELVGREYYLVNQAGQKVLSAVVEQELNSISVSHLSTGVYTLVIKGKSLITVKIVKN